MPEIELTDSIIEKKLEDLAVQVAVLDMRGVIVAVNDAWHQFSVNDGGDSSAGSVGASYLTVCDAVGDDPAAAKVAAALRSALGGDLGAAAIAEIPCHAPDAERWFDITISARTNEMGDTIGATVRRTAVTEQKREQITTEQVRDVRFRDAITALMAATRDATTIGGVRQAVVDGARLVTDSDSAVLNLFDEAGSTGVIVAPTGFNPDELPGPRAPLEASVSAEISRTGEPLLLRDAKRDATAWQPVADAGQVKSVVGVPLQSIGGVRGLLGASTSLTAGRSPILIWIA